VSTRKAMKGISAAGARRRAVQTAGARSDSRARRGAGTRAALESLLSVADAEAAARAVMPLGSFDYYAGGAEDERTLTRNRVGMDRWVLLHRVLVDVAHVDLATTVLGAPATMPIHLAPTAFHRLAHKEGELATARAAAKS
jgi:hypothetical protein